MNPNAASAGRPQDRCSAPEQALCSSWICIGLRELHRGGRHASRRHGTSRAKPSLESQADAPSPLTSLPDRTAAAEASPSATLARSLAAGYPHERVLIYLNQRGRVIAPARCARGADLTSVGSAGDEASLVGALIWNVEATSPWTILLPLGRQSALFRQQRLRRHLGDCGDGVGSIAVCMQYRGVDRES